MFRIWIKINVQIPWMKLKRNIKEWYVRSWIYASKEYYRLSMLQVDMDLNNKDPMKTLMYDTAESVRKRAVELWELNCDITMYSLSVPPDIKKWIDSKVEKYYEKQVLS